MKGEGACVSCMKSKGQYTIRICLTIYFLYTLTSIYISISENPEPRRIFDTCAYVHKLHELIFYRLWDDHPISLALVLVVP